MKTQIKKIYHRYHINEFRKSPFLWLYSAYLTLRHIDRYNHFPAIRFNSFIKVKFNKAKGSSIQVNSRLIFEAFLGSDTPTIFNLQKNASIIINNDFALGGGIKLIVCEDALLKLSGKVKETASGITADSTVMVKEHLEIGEDCLIAWNTFITDSDWHTVEGKPHTLKTIIGNHVWIGVGARVLKGAMIGHNSIITTNSVVLKGQYPNQVMLSGAPAKITGENIPNWTR